MIDSDVLNSDVTLTGVMEGKTFTITIKSNNSNNQTRTYSAKYGERFTLPSCPFSAVTNYTFNNYTCNGSTYSVGGGFTVTGNMTVTCNWNTVGLSGRSVVLKYWLYDGGVPAIQIISFDPDLNGKILNIEITNLKNSTSIYSHITLNNNALNKKETFNAGSPIHSSNPNLLLYVQNYNRKSYGMTTSSGSTICYNT